MARIALAGVIAVAGLATAACGESRSAETFCSTFKERAVALHDKYSDARDQIVSESDPFSGLISLVQAPGDLQVLFAALDKVAPDDIEPSVNQMLESLKKQQDAMNSGTKTGIVGGLLLGLQNAGAQQAVSDYLTQHCDLSYMQ